MTWDLLLLLLSPLLLAAQAVFSCGQICQSSSVLICKLERHIFYGCLLNILSFGALKSYYVHIKSGIIVSISMRWKYKEFFPFQLLTNTSSTFNLLIFANLINMTSYYYKIIIYYKESLLSRNDLYFSIAYISTEFFPLSILFSLITEW